MTSIAATENVPVQVAPSKKETVAVTEDKAEDTTKTSDLELSSEKKQTDAVVADKAKNMAVDTAAEPVKDKTNDSSSTKKRGSPTPTPEEHPEAKKVHVESAAVETSTKTTEKPATEPSVENKSSAKKDADDAPAMETEMMEVLNEDAILDELSELDLQLAEANYTLSTALDANKNLTEVIKDLVERNEDALLDELAMLDFQLAEANYNLSKALEANRNLTQVFKNLVENNENRLDEVSNATLAKNMEQLTDSLKKMACVLQPAEAPKAE